MKRRKKISILLLKYCIILIFVLLNNTHAEYGEWRIIEPTTTNKPYPLRNTAMVYNTINNSIIINSGNDNSNIFNQLWSFNLNSEYWNKINPIGDLPRSLTMRSLVFNKDDNSVITYGGYFNPEYYHQVDKFNFSTKTWQTNICNQVYHPIAVDHCAFFYKNKMYTFGGKTNLNLARTFQLLYITNNTWKTQVITGTYPAKLYSHTAVLVEKYDKVYVFGGFTNNYRAIEINDTYVLDLSSFQWEKITTTGDIPSPREGHTAVYDPVHNEIIICRGAYDWTPIAGLYALNINTYNWRKITEIGTDIPPAHISSASTYAPTTRRMYIFGFETAVVPADNNLYELSLNYIPVIQNAYFDGTYGDIKITYDLSDAENDVCSVKVEYKGGSVGGQWTTATVSGQSENISPGKNKTITWQSDKDEKGNRDDNYYIRISAHDGYDWSETKISTEKSIDNLPAFNKEGIRVSDNYIEFSSDSQIKFQYMLPQTENIKVYCYNLKGDLVKSFIDNEQQNAGEHIIQWDFKDENNKTITSGLYWIAISYGNKRFTDKFIVVK